MLSEEAKKAILAIPYYVVFVDKKGKQSTFVRVKNLTQLEFDEFVIARDIINREVLDYNDLYLIVVRVYDNLSKAYKKKVKAVNKENSIVIARDDLVDLNAYFTSFIANFGMYLACVPRRISRSRKNILDVHKKATNDEYDNYFAYRLITNLRNYSLHNTPPITGIRGSKIIGFPSEYEIYIEKSRIMEDGLIAKKLTDDLSKQEDKYPVMENVDIAVKSLSRIHWKTIKALIEEIEKSISIIESIKKLTEKQGKQPYIAVFRENKKTKSLDAELYFVPTHILDIKKNSQRY